MERIMYRSTNGISPPVTRREAILESQPPDGGLYVPTYIPQFKPGEIKSLRGKKLPEIGYASMDKFLKGEIPDEYIQEMCEKALDFPIPIEHVYGNVFTERLGMGPTGAFKDTAGRMLGLETSYYITQGDDGERWLLVATSGDTGAAIRGGFYEVPGINVIIFYPKDNVTKMQAALMDRYGKNIIALACEGKFPELQDMCMAAFADPALKKFKLMSANSIGIGRAQPQIIHAIYPLTDERVMESGRDPIFGTPSGNFGHAYAFLLAKVMGAYGEQILIANNANNVFDRFMKTGKYEVVDTIPTKSNAMDVNDPSNARRVFDMFDGKLVKDKKFIDKKGKESLVCRVERMPDMPWMRKSIWTTTISDDLAKETAKRLYDEYSFEGCPHTQVGMAAIEQHSKTRKDNPTYVGMSTAHQGKFRETLEDWGIPVKIPAYMQEVMDKPSFAIPFSNKYEDFKEFLLSGEAERVISRQKVQISQ